MILIADRFVVGAGGEGQNDIWLFDLQTKRSSIVWEDTTWVPSGESFLFLEGDRLYIVDGDVHVISLPTLSERIEDDKVRGAFCESLELPRVPKCILPPV